MGIVLGLMAALCWGLGDFLITQLTRRVGTAWALVGIQLLSLMAWIGLLYIQPVVQPGTPVLWVIVAATAVCHVLGLVWVYRAFEIGTLSVVSPISAGFAVVTALLSQLSGERPPAVTLWGAALLVFGVVLATRSSTPGGRQASLRGVPEAIFSALAFGTMFWLFYFHVQPSLGYAAPLIFLKALATGSAVLTLTVLRSRGRERELCTLSTNVVLLAVGAALADTVAWLTYIWGTSSTYATVVTALASLFSAVTVVLAWSLLRERLAVHQWTGIAVILLGILLVSL